MMIIKALQQTGHAKDGPSRVSAVPRVSGASGRYDALKDTAFTYAFLLTEIAAGR